MSYKKLDTPVKAVAGKPESRAPFVPSDQQQAIFDCLTDSEVNLMIYAGPGCGKSTTLIQALHRLPRGVKAGFTTFANAIAKELAPRVPRGVPCSTLHSFGNAIIAKALDSKPELEKYKSQRILEKLAPKIAIGESIAICKLVSLCKNMLVDAEDQAALRGLFEQFDVEIRDKYLAYDMVPAVIAESATQLATVDFDDMIWLPVYNDYATDKLDLLLVDEAQDLNRCQQELALRVANRFAFVGDKKQAIYGFRGADSISMERMEERLRETPAGVTSLPLTKTRRCPKSHVAMLQAIKGDSELQALDEAPLGLIANVTPVEALEAYQPGDFVLCRCNAPLLSTAFALIQRGKKVRIQGRDLGTTLLSLVKRFRATSVEQLLVKLRDYEAREENKIVAEFKYPENRLELLHDKCNCLRAICDGVEYEEDGPQVVQDICNRISTFFTETLEEGKDPEVVLLSSVHRGKGLEAERVFILQPELMPHPMAKRPADREQELNCLWVAGSRSKNELYFVGPTPGPLRSTTIGK